jgi:hypothetical protein
MQSQLMSISMGRRGLLLAQKKSGRGCERFLESYKGWEKERGRKSMSESREVCRRTAGVSGGDKDAQRKQHSLNRFVIVRQIYVAKTPYLKVVGIT